ncbi:hypothetical protein FB451DRAFT_1448858 [Mycena latifolia]|nr:hypothetical protein FB451DRAFT_1448858 [Mycena latifolia]
MNLRPRGRHKGRVASAATSTDECTTLALSSDAIRTAVDFVKEVADVFPPLKSVAGGVVAVWDLADRISSSDDDAQALAQRAVGIMKAIENALRGRTSPISSSMQADIDKFEALLREISAAMEKQLKQRGGLCRMLHLRRREGRLARFTARLDAASEAFNIGSSTRIELASTGIELTSTRVELMMEKIQADVSATAADVSTSIELASTRVESMVEKIQAIQADVSATAANVSSTAALVVVLEQSNIRLRDEAVVLEKSNVCPARTLGRRS